MWVLRNLYKPVSPLQDPALELSALHAPNASHILRREQPLVDSIVRGEPVGVYYLIIGPKGCGERDVGPRVSPDTSLKVALTAEVQCGRSMQREHRSLKVPLSLLNLPVRLFSAHPDLEVFRLRLGKALNFDYFEDWQGSLFSRADRGKADQLSMSREQ